MYENLIANSKRRNTIDKRPELDRAMSTRQQILASAEHIFFEKGAAATTLEQIAEKANVTRGAVYSGETLWVHRRRIRLHYKL